MEQPVKTDLHELFEHLGAGVLKPLLEQVVSKVTASTMVHGTKKIKGKVELMLDFVPHGETCQIVIDHKLKFTCPTHSGKKAEEIKGNCAFFVGAGGKLCSQQPQEEFSGQLDMFGADAC